MEDDAHLRSVFTRALQSAGYEVHQAASVQEARVLLSQFDFDVLICDIHVGKSRGTDLLREHGEMLLNSGGQIVMVSGYPRYRAVCEEMGADFFLEKPVSIQTLVTLTNRLTGAHNGNGSH
jgi:two-component system OmpR family response regulator/two-component system phosphate regulon response regulator OmpR